MSAEPNRHPIGLGAHLLADSGINRLRFSSVEELLDKGAVLVDETGRTSIRGAALLTAVQATRAVHTFECVISLCRIGRGVQAAMLNRSLLEDVLDIHWVAANPEIAPEFADRHERLLTLAERSMFHRFGRAAEPLTDDEQGEFAALQRDYRNFRASWTLATEASRRQLIVDRWGEEAAEQLAFVYDVIQRQNNALIHGSPAAYKQIVETDETGRTRGINRVGIAARWRDSLGHGALAFYFVCRVLAEHFNFDKQPVVDVFYRASCYLKDIDPEILAATDESSPCPCDSGDIAAHCHLS